MMKSSGAGAGMHLMMMMMLMMMWLVVCVGAAGGGEAQDTNPHTPFAEATNLQDVQAMLRQTRARITQQREELTRTNTHLNALIRRTQTRKYGYDEVAFTATFGPRYGNVPIGPYARDTPLIFDHIISNTADYAKDAYNPQRGVFTAPYRGDYRFDFHLMGSGQHGTGAVLEITGKRLFHNHLRKVRVLGAYSPKAPHYVTTSQSVDIFLLAGFQVRLLLLKGYWVNTHPDFACTFSGQLLKAEK